MLVCGSYGHLVTGDVLPCHITSRARMPHVLLARIRAWGSHLNRRSPLVTSPAGGVGAGGGAPARSPPATARLARCWRGWRETQSLLPSALMCSWCDTSPIVTIPAGIIRRCRIKLLRRRSVPLSGVITDAPTGLSREKTNIQQSSMVLFSRIFEPKRRNRL